MVNINKVYTKTGDKGETSLVGGRRLPKSDIRIEAYGTVDELNSIIGLVRSVSLTETEGEQWTRFRSIMISIQQKLFDIGSELATHREDVYEGQVITLESDVIWLETIIDKINENLKPLTSFVLPGGELLNAYLHQARTVCRRTERQVIHLSKQISINPFVLIFLNRLSDLLFVMARWVCIIKKVPETLWQSQKDLPSWDS
ncbi:cob(I)yrinic acid a,c-diamide adenosyltransferase [bacterium]|nr:cob(I)yrinic acid a,c-diamide adenosyltransferase [bacterium]